METNVEILLAEKPFVVAAGTTLLQLRDRVAPGADVVVYNGAPAETDLPLSQGDAVVFIKRGDVPDRDTLEALMAARHTPGVHAILKRSVVGIAGAGGLGSAVAVALARVGIGTLRIADFDVVEPSNLNRQQFFVDQIGEAKVDALAANLARINPYVQVSPAMVRLDPDNIPAILGDVQILVEAFDRADQKAMLVGAWRRHFPTRPIVAATGLAGHRSSNTVLTRRVGKYLYVVGDQETAACPGTGLMAPRVGVAAHHQANAVLRLLLGEDPASEE